LFFCFPHKPGLRLKGYARTTRPLRRQRVHTFTCLTVPLSLIFTLFKFGLKTRFVWMFEWETLLPATVFFPHTKHTLAISNSYVYASWWMQVSRAITAFIITCAGCEIKIIPSTLEFFFMGIFPTISEFLIAWAFASRRCPAGLFAGENHATSLPSQLVKYRHPYH
jgi:hypothetical protein